MTRRLRDLRALLIPIFVTVAFAAPAQASVPEPPVQVNSQHCYSVRTATPVIIAIHTTEGPNATGLRDLLGLGTWFGNCSHQASSQVGVDAEGFSGRYAPDSAKAWTVANYNSLSLNIENVGFAAQTRADWDGKTAQLRTDAMWIAYWHGKYGIPIQRALASRSVVRVDRAGVLYHEDLGIPGGGHHDPCLKPSSETCAYPLARVLEMARQFVGGKPPQESHAIRVRHRRLADLKLIRSYAKRFGWKSQERARYHAIERRLSPVPADKRPPVVLKRGR